MKYLHIMNNEKFNKAYIEFIELNFEMEEHIFIFWGGNSEDEIPILKRKNVKRINSIFDILNLIIMMNKNNKIYLHSLFSSKLLLLLYLQPWILKNCHWLLWGADLYRYSSKNSNLKSKMVEKLRIKVISNMGYILTQVKGDYELAQEVYKTKAKRYYTFLYQSNVFDIKNIKYKDTEKRDEKIYIQIGNSGDSRNNHREVFEKIEKYKNMNIEIICPLSYGDKEYIKSICELGETIFGEKFNPLLKLIPYEDYINILNKINIAIFNHDRQQALGNTTQLLGFGKKVYIRNDITTWEFAKEHNLRVYATNEIDDTLFDIDVNEMNSNIKNIEKNFSMKKLTKDWKSIFNN